MPRRLSGASAPASMSASIRDGGALAQRIGRRVGLRTHQGATSFSTSIGACSMSCCFITSSHQVKSEPFSVGDAWLNTLARTISIGCFVNLEIEAAVFSWSPLTIAAASSIEARNALIDVRIFLGDIARVVT